MKKLATIIVSILILVAVLIPGSRIPEVSIGGFDKVVHIIMFMTWAIAFYYDYPVFRPTVIFLAGLAFSLLTEVLQLFAEGRSFDLFDMMADSIGLLIGIAVARPATKLVRKLFKR